MSNCQPEPGQIRNYYQLTARLAHDKINLYSLFFTLSISLGAQPLVNALQAASLWFVPTWLALARAPNKTS